jgi:NAD(P)H-flavin reductase
VAIALDGGIPDFSARRHGTHRGSDHDGSDRSGTDRPSADRQGPDRRGSSRRYPIPPGRSRPARPLAGLEVHTPATTESAAGDTPDGDTPAALDIALIKETFGRVTANAPLAMEHFYARLFTASPETRGMFPMGMSQMRERVFAELSRMIGTLDRPEDLTAYLTRLGADHRKYGVRDGHYHAFFTALLDTAAYLNGSAWTPPAEAAWAALLKIAARTMRDAAADDARNHPPWWTAEIVGHEQRTATVAVLTLAPDQPLPYRAGQYVPVQVPRWPRVWRPYSVACAPRPYGRIELHVRAVPGGMVSTALVRHVSPGDTVLLGPAAGTMTAPDDDRDLLCVAGGTGLAPVKAIIEATAARPRSGRRTRRITLFAGARRAGDLYDLADLRRLAAAVPGLRIIPVLSGENPADATADWLTGLLPDVVAAQGLFDSCHAYISGPQALVDATTVVLSAHLPAGHIHHDPPAARPGPAAWAPPAVAVTVPAPGTTLPPLTRSELYATFGQPAFR